jgi:hypothetical protein
MSGAGRTHTGNYSTLFDRLVAYLFPANAKILGSVKVIIHQSTH